MPSTDRIGFIKRIQEIRQSHLICFLTSLRPGVPAQIAEDSVRVFFDPASELTAKLCEEVQKQQQQQGSQLSVTNEYELIHAIIESDGLRVSTQPGGVLLWRLILSRGRRFFKKACYHKAGVIRRLLRINTDVNGGGHRLWVLERSRGEHWTAGNSSADLRWERLAFARWRQIDYRQYDNLMSFHDFLRCHAGFLLVFAFESTHRKIG